ncbi:hypothetical protein J6590_004071 [Homalodisca vitripennis]|nr:hypothetical protein J6590_004071 [Homalodisca vitripennis]
MSYRGGSPLYLRLSARAVDGFCHGNGTPPPSRKPKIPDNPCTYRLTPPPSPIVPAVSVSRRVYLRDQLFDPIVIMGLHFVGGFLLPDYQILSHPRDYTDRPSSLNTLKRYHNVRCGSNSGLSRYNSNNDLEFYNDDYDCSQTPATETLSSKIQGRSARGGAAVLSMGKVVHNAGDAEKLGQAHYNNLARSSSLRLIKY